MVEGEGKFVTLRFARARISRVVGRCRALRYAVSAWYFMVFTVRTSFPAASRFQGGLSAFYARGGLSLNVYAEKMDRCRNATWAEFDSRDKLGPDLHVCVP